MGLTLAFSESVFHALVLMAGRLGANDLAALGIMYQVRRPTYCPPVL